MNKLFLSLLCLFALVLGACNDCPIEGKWEAAPNEYFLDVLGCNTLKFTSSRMYLCGTTSRAEYKVDGDKVIVNTPDGEPLVCHMTGPNQMYFELSGKKLYWNRVE